MKRIYFDNAATTPIDKEVLAAMLPFMEEHFGNPSSTHFFGRQTKAALETARKEIAERIHATPSEIFFTSGGTEADNMAIHCSVRDLGVKRIISSQLEHHAVLHVVEALEKDHTVEVVWVKLLENGHVDIDHLKELLEQSSEKTLVSLMHANNEIGNLLDIQTVGKLCQAHGALFHSDTVQTVGHYPIDVNVLPIDFLTCSAHKFHGPKGIGFLYVNGDVKIKPLLSGGSQERNLRAGTENLCGIVGLAKALAIAERDMEAHQAHIQGLKHYMVDQLKQEIPGMSFNGDAEGRSLYTVLNAKFPPTPKGAMLTYALDIEGIAVSSGSACSSGSEQGSHVLSAIDRAEGGTSVRFSFSKYNTKEEVDVCVDKLKQLVAVPA